MDKVDTGTFVEIEFFQFIVFFDDGSTQTFIIEDGAAIEDFPQGTEGTPAFKRVSHTDGSVEDIYMHHVHFTRWVKSTRKRRVSVPVDDTKTPQTTELRSKESDT